MKFLAVDYGQKRTGLAVSDPGERMAFPRATLLMRGKDIFFAELLALAENEGVQAFVIGLPLRSGNEDSESARRVRNMAARLARRSKLPVYLMPEFLSSHEAEGRLREAGKRGGQISGAIDQASAVAILESFLALPQARRALAAEHVTTPT
ncbi:MAG: Holliday junction resolvase RuvX [Desulfovibrio sp.]|jgi:putative Holliday junction resolvase|nr:Holliday junction resolvase RuvX [Desulfovibrio sp.]